MKLLGNSALAAILALGLAACQQSDSAPSADETSADRTSVEEAIADEPRPLADVAEAQLADQDALYAWLQEGSYRDFAHAEEELHKSIGPHDLVKVFFNQTVVDSINAGNETHPAGSMIVKEMYKEGAAENHGWAVMIKTEDQVNDGESWYWYEITDKSDPTALYPDQPGHGIVECTGCHVPGNDYVRSHLQQ